MADLNITRGQDFSEFILKGIEQGLKARKEQEVKEEIANVMRRFSAAVAPRTEPDQIDLNMPPTPTTGPNMDLQAGMMQPKARDWSGAFGAPPSMNVTPGKTTYPSNEQVTSEVTGEIGRMGGIHPVTAEAVNRLVGETLKPGAIHSVSPGSSWLRGDQLMGTAPEKSRKGNYVAVAVGKDKDGNPVTKMVDKDSGDIMWVEGDAINVASVKERGNIQANKDAAENVRLKMKLTSAELIAKGHDMSREKIAEGAGKFAVEVQRLRNQGLNQRAAAAAAHRNRTVQDLWVELSTRAALEPDTLTDEELLLMDEAAGLIAKQGPNIIGQIVEKGARESGKLPPKKPGLTDVIREGREQTATGATRTYKGKQYPVQKHPKSGLPAILTPDGWKGVPQ